MLSIENPPPDPPCLHLKPSTVPATHVDNLIPNPHPEPEPEPEPAKVDLLKQPSSSLDHHHHHTPVLPKFSIRDYVFTARSKDIKKNWPFSPKNLQLCLKHGLKDPLPPFQPLHTVRNQSLKRSCTVESNPFEKQHTRKFDQEPSGSNDDHVVLGSSSDARSNRSLAVTCIDNSSCRSEGEHENDHLPSTTTSVSQSEITSVPIGKHSKLPLETDTSAEASAEVQAAGPYKSQRSEHTTRPSGKKCRLVVKFGAHSDRSSTEDIASNCTTTVLESMASKVCPVCKTFSSSSNTTLNAHIDQCLSVEPTPKWTADSKLSRHRIKPRKTRLMVDVYATAKPCTLEELDRRNGTSWATTSNMPRQDSEGLETSDSAEGKRQRVSPIHPEDTGDVGAVYIDANGTKVRILSKFNDVPAAASTKVGLDLGPHKPLKGVKGSKFFSTKKGRRHAQKHHKYLKLAPQSRKFFSHKSRSSMLVGGQEGYSGGGSCKNEGQQVPKQIRTSDSRNSKERVCSKRSGLSRKSDNQERHQPLICKWHVTRDLQVESDRSHQGDHLLERNCARKSKSPSENPNSSLEKCERIQKPVYESPVVDEEHSFGRKRVRSPLFGARSGNMVERSFRSLKQNKNQVNKDQPYLHETSPNKVVRSLDSDGNCTPSLSKKTVDRDANNNPDTPLTATTPISHHSIKSKCLRFSSPKKNVLSASSRPLDGSRSNLVKKYGTKESQLHFMAEIDEAVAWDPEADEECDLVHDGAKNQFVGKEINEELSFGGSVVNGAREQRGRGGISGREETMVLKSINSAPHCYDHDERENTDSSARGNEEILDRVDGLESVEETVSSLHQSVETQFNNLNNPSHNSSNSLQTIEDYSGHLCGGEGLGDPSEPSLVDKQDMFCAEVGNGIIGQAANMGGELDSDTAQRNFFSEVDPIPIPGPPGSFLPSPRDMGSDDFQGNSSLTTSRIQSSQDQLDLVDGDSSDSPLSAVSTISSSAEARSDLKYAEPSAFVGAPSALEKDRSGYTTSNSEPIVENGAAVPQTSTGPERTFEGEKFKVNRISMEKRPFFFKNDDQPCCCQRKERSSLGFSLNYQDSQLLRRRTMSSMMVPATALQTGANPDIRPNNLDARPETFALSTSSNLGSEIVMNPPAGAVPFKGCPDGGVKRFDPDSASPSSSNPILRLMGKNLMVVNKEEDASMPLSQATSAQSNGLSPNFVTSSGVSPSNVPNHGGMSFHHPMPQGSSIFGQNPNDFVGQPLDVRLTHGYKNHANPGTAQTPLQFPTGMFLDENVDCGNFPASMELYKHEGNYNFPTPLNRPKNKLGPAATYSKEKITSLDFQQRCGDSAVSSKEVIVIDDSPESETNKAAEVCKHSKGPRESQLMSYGISMPLVPDHVARNRNPFSRYQSADSPLLGNPAVVHNDNFHAIPTRRANASSVRWDCTSEGSSVLQRGPFVAVSPSTSYLRPALYYSPSLS